MTPYVIEKSLNIEKFEKYISNAQNTNQWSNNGWAVKELESRARDLLNIDDSKAVVATCSGTTALHAMLWESKDRMDAKGLLHKTLLLRLTV